MYSHTDFSIYNMNEIWRKQHKPRKRNEDVEEYRTSKMENLMHVRNEDVEEYRTSKLKNQMNEKGEDLSSKWMDTKRVKIMPSLSSLARLFA